MKAIKTKKNSRKISFHLNEKLTNYDLLKIIGGEGPVNPPPPPPPPGKG